ncbi:hypothetical protein ACLKA7_012294 [Drosophila subpalustris]
MSAMPISTLAAAKNHLIEFMSQILALNKQKGQTNENRVSSEASETSLVQLDNGLKQTSQSTCSLLNEFMNSIEVGSEGENSEEEDEPELRLATIEIYGYSPKPIDVNVDIMSYWKEKKFIYPSLYCLAKAALHFVNLSSATATPTPTPIRLVPLQSSTIEKCIFAVFISLAEMPFATSWQTIR